MKLQGSEIVVKSLLSENVDTIFGYPGGAIMPVYDSLYGYLDQINHVLTRHEQGAIHAAQGYARVSDKVGVCFATSGPGATNLITGLADAMIDSTPLVCITGQVAKHLLGTDAFQETDIIGISTPVTKWNIQVTKAEDIAPAIAKAFYIAKSGRPGPVVIDITKDAQFSEADFSYEKCTKVRSYKALPKVDTTKVDEAIQLINEAKQPYILVGQGVTLGNAEKEFMDFVEQSGIPVAWTLLGVQNIPTNHPQNMGMLGMHGNYAPNLLTNECDVLIAIGMRFDDRVTGNVEKYAKQAKVIHLELDPAEIDKIIKADVAVVGDCKESLPMFTKQIKKKEYTEWYARFKELQKEEYEEVIQHDMNPSTEGMLMSEVIRVINENKKEGAILTVDVGQHQMAASRYFQFDSNKSNVQSGGLGTMGFGLPSAIGAKLGAPKRQVISISGDGGFQMNIQELGTIAQEELDIKILVLNNQFLGMVRQWQELFFERRYSFTDMKSPDLVKLADSYGIQAKSINQRGDLQEAIKEFLNSKGSYLLEVVVEKEDNVFPMMPTGAAVDEVRLS
ncbi:acetolactate synthase [Flavobacteriaceae bacterium UJ101]|nr:acetolactate synthase [Flavobacteriaceae bacterium UJ101]